MASRGAGRCYATARARSLVLVNRFQLLTVALSKAPDLAVAAAGATVVVLAGALVAVQDGAGVAALLTEAMNRPAATVMVAIAAVIALLLVLLVFMVFSSVDNSTLGRWAGRKN